MINKRGLKEYCCEDISLIENYDKAINDNKQTWHCHHRKETNENFSIQELKERNLYYNRPANELIFLTPAEHCSLHDKFRIVWNKGKKGLYKPTPETKQKQSQSLKGKNKGRKATPEAIRINSECHKGKTHSEETKKKLSEISKNRKFINKNGVIKFIKQADVDKYIQDGWRLGRK